MKFAVVTVLAIASIASVESGNINVRRAAAAAAAAARSMGEADIRQDMFYRQDYPSIHHRFGGYRDVSDVPYPDVRSYYKNEGNYRAGYDDSHVRGSGIFENYRLSGGRNKRINDIVSPPMRYAGPGYYYRGNIDLFSPKRYRGANLGQHYRHFRYMP